jgi:hypothetical protein
VLAGSGPRRQAAPAGLHGTLVRVAQGEVAQRGPRLRITGPGLEDLAYQAAADALLAITGKIGRTLPAGRPANPAGRTASPARARAGMHASAPGGTSIVSPICARRLLVSKEREPTARSSVRREDVRPQPPRTPTGRERSSAATVRRRPGSGLAGGEGQQMKIVSSQWRLTAPRAKNQEKQCAF